MNKKQADMIRAYERQAEKALTPAKAKTIISQHLAALGLPAFKLTARTVDFTDLARASCIFVKIHGWKPSPLWHRLADLAINNKFRIE